MANMFDDIVSVLAPGVGESLARASVDMHLSKVGLDRQTLGPQHLEELVRAIQPGLAVFVGKADATLLADRLLGLSRNGA
jgi:hypothetical protein